MRPLPGTTPHSGRWLDFRAGYGRFRKRFARPETEA
jgi:hypothetical protein